MTGKLRVMFWPQSTRGRIYAETFAIWFVSFWGMQLGIAFLPMELFPIAMRLAATLVIFFLLTIVGGYTLCQTTSFLANKLRQPAGCKIEYSALLPGPALVRA